MSMKCALLRRLYCHSRTASCGKRNGNQKTAVEVVQISLLGNDIAIPMALNDLCDNWETRVWSRASRSLYGLQTGAGVSAQNSAKRVITKR